MRAIPNLDDQAAMAARGRRSTLMSLRNEACEELRDMAVTLNGCDVFNDDITVPLKRARAALDRLQEIHALAASKAD